MTASAPDVSPRLIDSFRYSLAMGWMMPSSSATTTRGRSDAAAWARADAAAPAAESSAAAQMTMRADAIAAL